MTKRKNKKHRGQPRRGASAKAKKTNGKKRDSHEEVQTFPTGNSGIEPKEKGGSQWKGRVLGLENLRNTCYFNSILQLLLSSSHLRNVFNGMEERSISPNAVVTSSLCELFNHPPINCSKKAQFKPSRILGVVRTVEPTFKNRTQHDSHELMIALLRHLVEEAESMDNRSTAWMENLFGGKLTSVIKCNNCCYSRSREEGFLVLSVSVMRDQLREEKKDAGKENPSSGATLELPDVRERDDEAALRHLRPSGSGSTSSQNNDASDSASDLHQLERRSDDDEDTYIALQDLFATADESETPCPSDALLNGEIAANNELFQMTSPKKGRKKGKQRRKQADRFDSFDFETTETEVVSESYRFQSMEECLQHFFAHESVTWRCPKEFPEKRVTFSEKKPEIFSVPSKCKSRCGNWKSYFDDSDLNEEGSSGERLEDDETTTQDASAECTIDDCHLPTEKPASPDGFESDSDIDSSQNSPSERIRMSESPRSEELDDQPIESLSEKPAASGKEKESVETECLAFEEGVEPTNPSNQSLSNHSEKSEDDEGTSQNEFPASSRVLRPTKSCLKKDNAGSASTEFPQLNSTKQYFLSKQPQVLCIHLKRFQALSQRRVSKLNHAVKFDSTLHLGPYMGPRCECPEDIEYDLKAIVCHAGSLNFGHYTAYVSRTGGDQHQWYYVSDSDVRSSSLSEVMDCQAYILLYERRESASGNASTQQDGA